MKVDLTSASGHFYFYHCGPSSQSEVNINGLTPSAVHIKLSVATSNFDINSDPDSE